MGRAVPLFVVLAGCALALPCAASAVPIVSLGATAGAPGAVTDGAGTLHVVWHTYEQQGGPDMLSYCRVPAGGTTCTPVILGGFPSIVVGNPHLLLRPQDGALIIVVPGLDDQSNNVTFALSYRLPFAAGTRHVAEARVTYRLRGRVRHTSVGRAIVTCP